MVAGATGIDLFLLVIDAREGARPQTHEHLAILRLLGIERGVVAVTKADAVDEETLELALEEARELVPGAEVVAGQRQDRRGPRRAARGARARPPSSERDRRPRDAAVRRPRLHAPGHRHGRHRHAAGRARSRPATCCASSPRACARARAQRPGARRARSSAPRPASASRVNLPGDRARAASRAATCSSSRAHYPVSYRLDVALEELEPVPAAVTVHVGTSDVAGARRARGRATRSCGCASRSSPRAATASCCARETTVGGGIVLDPAPPRRSTRRGSSCSSAATRRRSSARSCASPSPARSCRRAGCSRRPSSRADSPPSSAPGDWFFAAEWLDELRATRARAARRARALDAARPGHPARRAAAARAVGAGGPAPAAASSAAAARPTSRARRRARRPAAAAAELEARLAAEDIVRVDDRKLARLPRGPRARSSASATASRSRPGSTSAAARRSQTLAPITLAGFRDALGISRRTAQLLLERYDADGLTLPRRRRAPAPR